VAAQGVPCAPRDAIAGVLAAQYGESVQAAMIGGRPGTGVGFVEMFANLESGSWSLVFTPPGGLTCLIAAGSDYRAIPQTPPGVPG
jgi:hypothetical protein